MTESRMSRTTMLVVLCATVYALFAFFIHWRWFPIGDLGVESDFYAEMAVSAQRLAGGHFAVADYPFKGPLTAIALVAVHGLVGLLGADWYRSAVLLNALCAAGTLVVLFGLQDRLFGRALAVVTTLALALTYEFFLHAHKASSDLLYLLLFVATASAVIGAEGRQRLLGAGVLAGLAFLTRYSGAVLVAAAVLVEMIPLRTVVGVSLRERAGRTGVFLVGFLVVCLPWFTVSLVETGRPLQSGNLTNVVQEFYGGEQAAEMPAGGFASLREVVMHDPGAFLKRFAGNGPRHLAMDMVQVVGRRVWWLVAAGALVLLAAASWRGRGSWAESRRPTPEQWAWFVFAACSFLAMMLVFHRPRFSLPLVPIYFSVGYGALFGFRRALGVGTSRRLMSVAAVIVIAVSVQQIAFIIDGERFYYARRPLEVLREASMVHDAAQRLGAHTMLARKPHLAHYAGLEHRRYAAAVNDWDTFFAGICGQGIDLILVGEREREAFPEAEFLTHLDLAAGVETVLDQDGFKLFHVDRNRPCREIASVPAADELRRTIRDAQRDRNDGALFSLHSELSVLMTLLQQWDEAAVSLAACLDLAAAAPDAVSRADRDDLALNLAFCRLRTADYDDGLAILGADLEHLAPTADKGRDGMRHAILARLLDGAGRAEAARRHFRLAFDLYRQAGYDQAARDVAASLAALDAR